MKKIFRKMLKLIRGILFLPFWWLERLIPRSKRIFVFGGWGGRKYSDNSKALYEYIIKNVPKLKPYWITGDKRIYQKLMDDNKPVAMTYSIKGWLLSLRAFFVINSNSDDRNLYAVNGAKIICLWHGMPLKKIEYDTKLGLRLQGKNVKTGIKIKNMIRDIIFPYYKYNKKPYSTISSADFFIPFLLSAFLLDKKNIWLTGLPRTDWFYERKTEKIISNLRNNEKYINSRVILYMPTFRRMRNYGNFFNPFNIQSFNSDKFIDFLEKEDVVFLYKPHNFDHTFNFSLLSERFVLINDDDYDELYVLISNIDILVTDYSSVYFDFLCLNKPAILTPFDYDVYIQNYREHYFDYNLLPSIKAYNWDELMSIIVEKKYYSIPKGEADKFCKYNDGHATERVLQKTLELLDKTA
jgi:CDP-glycerol glycerophosphotransferase